MPKLRKHTLDYIVRDKEGREHHKASSFYAIDYQDAVIQLVHYLFTLELELVNHKPEGEDY
jgi:hypothetical protein